MTAPVAIVMGSQSDWPTMRRAAEALDTLEVAYDTRIVGQSDWLPITMAT